MKKLVLLVTLISFSGATFAAEPLLLEPLTPAQLGNKVPTATTQQGATPKVMVQGTNGVYEAIYTNFFILLLLFYIYLVNILI